MFDRGIHPKPQKMKELTEIGGGYAHVRVGGFVVVIYNSRHVSLEMSVNGKHSHHVLIIMQHACHVLATIANK